MGMEMYIIYFLLVNCVYYSIGKIVTTSLYHEYLFLW